MSRYFMVQSWVGSHENEPDYNGNQCGERNVRSSEVVPLYDQYGNANVKAFADQPGNKSKTKQLSAFSKACTADRAFERLEKLSLQLDDEYAAEKISSEDWVYARKQLDAKLERAWAKVCKLRGWNASEYGSATSVQGRESTLCFATKKPTNNGNSIDVYNGQRSVFEELSDDNIFKRAYLLIKKLKRG